MKVLFLPAAEHDLGSIFSYIKDDLNNPVAARTIATKILRRAQGLANFPEMGANLESVDSKLGGYRYLAVDNYLIIISVINAELRIVRILYARSDYVQLFHG